MLSRCHLHHIYISVSTPMSADRQIHLKNTGVGLCLLSANAVFCILPCGNFCKRQQQCWNWRLLVVQHFIVEKTS